MGHVAAYDRIADWYEHEFLGEPDDRDPLGIHRALRVLLGPGRGPCLELGCGTGVHARVVRELGGLFVHVGVHPCFCGGFADHTDREAIVIRPGYLAHHFTYQSWTDGIRNKVGATHWPLPELLDAFLAAGLALDGFAEGGAPTPTVLAVRARKG
jgi:hypothetical protein